MAPPVLTVDRNAIPPPLVPDLDSLPECSFWPVNPEAKGPLTNLAVSQSEPVFSGLQSFDSEMFWPDSHVTYPSDSSALPPPPSPISAPSLPSFDPFYPSVPIDSPGDEHGDELDAIVDPADTEASENTGESAKEFHARL